ncbi:hypothetical protein HDU80_007754 [Chytriomyces hyalinus]|nr:hypothetical protein HDU80_007754 [Chytriomyces hyalinus]
MATLPVEVIQAILMHADIDKDLLQFGLVCRKFAATVQDTTLALEHIRRRFLLSREGIRRFTKLDAMVRSPGLDAADMSIWRHHQGQLFTLNDQIELSAVSGDLPFAYKAALFVLASQVDQWYNIVFPADITLRIVQSIGSAHPIDWDTTVIFLATASNESALDYIITNHLRVISNTAIVTAIEAAVSLGQTVALSQLLACPSSDPEPLSLDAALV